MSPEALLATCFHTDFSLGLFLDPEDVDYIYIPQKGILALNGLHGVISQKVFMNKLYVGLEQELNTNSQNN
jgi:hypothetical protein